MTVIVQPITVPPPETASDVIAQHLQKLLGTLTYENFAPTVDGEIIIYDTAFHYRVGLFLAVPTEVIIAAGQFVKMHQIKEKAKYWTGLKVIDPERPDDCLYERYNTSMDETIKGWCPPSLQSVGQSTSPGTMYAQQSLLVQQGLLGLGQLWQQPYGTTPGLQQLQANQMQASQNLLANQGQYLSQASTHSVLKQQQTPPGLLRKIFGIS